MKKNMKDVVEAVRLWHKCVTAANSNVDYDRLRDVVRRETRAAEQELISVTPGLLSELRADRALVGQLYNESR